MAIHRLELASDGVASSARASGPRVRVAIASQDGKGLNAHFGFARKLMVYDVTPRGHRLVRALSFASGEQDGAREAPDGERIRAKVAALDDCHVLYVLAIGPAAAARVIQSDIHPIKLGAPEPIASVIARMQAMLKAEPPSWLRRILFGTDVPRSPNT